MERKVTRGIDAPEVEGYLWDGWKLIMIAKLNTDGTFHSRKWSCVWRPDIGSSLYARSDWMRAGGVGGVAWLQTGAVQSYSYGTGGAEVHVPLADHMGNVRHYYQFKASGSKVTGQLVASYEYDAFGREVRAWGLNTPATNQPPGLPASRPWADLLPFHYSSKLRDADSGFNYYGYRFYDPGAGRWLNRDPIGERGGLNLYGMVGNDAVNWIDYLGWDPFAVHSTGNKKVGDDNTFKNRAVRGVGEKNAKPYVSGQDLLAVCRGMKNITSLDIHGHGNTDGIGAGGTGNGMYIQDYRKPGVTSTVQELADAIKKGEIDVKPGAEIRIFACQCSPFAKALADALAEKRPDIKVTGATSNVDNGVADAEKGADGKYKRENGKFVPGKFETHQGGKVIRTAPSIPIVPKP